MNKILIVSLKAGAGHVRAAQAIEEAIGLKYPDFEVKNVDLLDYANILSKEFYGNWYLDVANKIPKFYAFLYHRLDSSSTRIRLLTDRLNTRKFQKLIRRYNPDLIICTHFVPANLATFWRTKYHYKFKVLLTLTDYEAHKLWVDNSVDVYTTATGTVKDQLISCGAKSNKIKVTGIPVNVKFTQNFNKKIIRKKLKLKDQFTIALFAGAFGVGSLEKILGEIIKIKADFQILAIAGKNKLLRDEFMRLSENTGKIIKVFGYANNMEEIMAASDIAISKAGGLIISECLDMGLPLIINHPYPGQEEANSRFLVQNQAAFAAETSQEVIDILKQIVKNPKSLDKIRRNIQKMSKPNAAKDIATIAQDLLN